MNDPELTCLISTSSIKDIRQLEGRIRTVDNLIIDIVDNHGIYEKHWEKRKEWYLKRGATIMEEGFKGGTSRSKNNKNEPRTKRYL